MAFCKQCGRCCAAFSIIPVTDAEAERYGREFCEREANGRWCLRFPPRSWAPLGDSCCVFLLPSRRCAVHDQKPSVCATWDCAAMAKQLAYAMATLRVNGALCSPRSRRRAERRQRVAYNEYLEEWHRVTAPMQRAAGNYTHRSPFEQMRIDGSDPRWFKDVPGFGFPAIRTTKGGENDGRALTVD